MQILTEEECSEYERLKRVVAAVKAVKAYPLKTIGCDSGDIGIEHIIDPVELDEALATK